MAQYLGTIACSYKHLTSTFGEPTFAIDRHDFFDGSERCTWVIEFESGHTALISEEVESEDSKYDFNDKGYQLSTGWKINAHAPVVYDWIKQAIRDSNPLG
jgi:hypothetical protein